jgi:hypothetical protein
MSHISSDDDRALAFALFETGVVSSRDSSGEVDVRLPRGDSPGASPALPGIGRAIERLEHRAGLGFQNPYTIVAYDAPMLVMQAFLGMRRQVPLRPRGNQGFSGIVPGDQALLVCVSALSLEETLASSGVSTFLCITSLTPTDRDDLLIIVLLFENARSKLPCCLGEWLLQPCMWRRTCARLSKQKLC